ncbi:hypothetical protein JOL62DRAFT_392108 [Phyllosticta paracitricarpa]|uniref:Secreted protein n=1 Tax=Phyllosticta paracitricarpa TaxID=2016321 RepID=A0ABR1MVU4_9PEZI
MALCLFSLSNSRLALSLSTRLASTPSQGVSLASKLEYHSNDCCDGRDWLDTTRCAPTKATLRGHAPFPSTCKLLMWSKTLFFFYCESLLIINQTRLKRPSRLELELIHELLFSPPSLSSQPVERK